MSRLKPRERDAIVQALRAGVVPKLGLRHIQVGRVREIEELVKDMDRIADGGAAIRFIIGEYGSGKTFFMNLIRLIALEKGMVVMFADLAPDRRIHATGGQARGLYAEMARNFSTRTKPDGGAMASVVERFVSQANRDAEVAGQPTGTMIRQRLGHFEELTGGFDFAEVIRRYWEGHETGNDELTSAALRWLRGEYATRTDARKALGVRTIIDDANVYDHLKGTSIFDHFRCRAADACCLKRKGCSRLAGRCPGTVTARHLSRPVFPALRPDLVAGLPGVHAGHGLMRRNWTRRRML
ncbi:MAG: ATP-binding protein [Burkholderiaceae bacterium]|nr:ATP-binding protein [Burkholderiaceae bacterium]